MDATMGGLPGGLPPRGWAEGGIREPARARRGDEPLTLMLLDVDDFQMFCDAFGEKEARRLLKQVTISWLGYTRPYDLMSHFGDREFALAMPGAGRDQALNVWARLNAAMPHGHDCSAGIAQWDGLEGLDDLVDRAEVALEAAKRAGRGQAVSA